MGFFKNLIRRTGSVFRKAGGEISHVFRKGGNTIARGLGGLTGSAIGAGIGGAIGSLAGPEGSLAGAAIGRIVGGAAGSEGASRIEESTRRPKGAAPTTAGQQLHNIQRRHQMGGAMPIPDGKFFQGRGGKTGMRPGQPSQPIKIPKPVLPGPAPRPILGRDGHGQRQMPPAPAADKGNELEKMRRKQEAKQRFI